MPTFPKIITKLRERRQIEADLRQMRQANSEVELQQQAQRIAALGPQVIPAIVGNLDRADSQLLTAMGTVALFLDRDEVAFALRQAVRQPQRTDQGRIGAVTILERFLGETVDDGLLTSLVDPEKVALSSLVEVLAQAAADPSVLIDYVQGLDRQEPDVVLAVGRALAEIGDQRAIEPLRMMAQDVRVEIAADAIRICATIRLPEAARALQTLIPIIHPELRPQAERALRRLRFAGVRVEDLPRPDPNWRALVSPVDGQGQRNVWFIQERRTAQVRFLNILLNDRFGAVEAVGYSQVSAHLLPPRWPVGQLHDMALPDGSGALLMLEVPFDVGRRLVLDALALNRETQIPVAGPLRLSSPWLWALAGADALPPRVLPELTPKGESLWLASAQLLDHPAFATWTVQSEAILEAAEALRHKAWNRNMWVRRLSAEFVDEPVVVEVLSERLTAMSEWLLASGDKIRSRIALATAWRLQAGAPPDLPLVKALVRRDLEFAVHSLMDEDEPLGGENQVR